MLDWRAVAAGTGVDVTAAMLAATLPLPEYARWPVFAVVSCAGLLGGHVAGRLADGPWRRRVGHGLLAGAIGGVAFAVAVWWSLQPDAPSGALWPVNYAVATVGLPTDLAARFDAAIGVVVASLGFALFVAEGALAAGATAGASSGTDAVYRE